MKKATVLSIVAAVLMWYMVHIMPRRVEFTIIVSLVIVTMVMIVWEMLKRD